VVGTGKASARKSPLGRERGAVYREKSPNIIKEKKKLRGKGKKGL